MNYLFVTAAREIGGAEVYLLNILDCLKNNGSDFALICGTQGPFSKQVKGHYNRVSEFDFGASFGRYRGLSIYTPSTRRQQARFLAKLSELSKVYDFRCIHAQQDLKEKAFASIAGSKLDIPVIWTEHGMLHPWIKSTPFKRYYRYLANSKAAKIICVSNAVKKDLLEIGVYDERLTVIHNGVARPQPLRTSLETRNALGLKQEHIVFTSTARLYKKKGIQDMLSAATQIRGEYPNIRLLIVGDGPYRQQLERESVQLYIDDISIFTGFRRDIADLVQGSNVIVSPTYDRTEGLPLRILEGMALSKPIIATDISGTRECVEHNSTGLLVKPRDIEDMANAMRKLASDEMLCQSLGDRGNDLYKREFTLERMCERTIALLDDVYASQKDSAKENS